VAKPVPGVGVSARGPASLGLTEGKVAGRIGVAYEVAAQKVELYAGLDEMLAALHGEAGLKRVVVTGLLLPANPAFQAFESADADSGKILELRGVDERLRETERRQVETGGEGLLLFLAVGESDTGVEDCARADQIGIVDGDALIGPVHDVAARSGESGEIVVEVEKSGARVGPH
jgi:hypothetical protein